jgi:3'-5' exoribonuclease
VGMAENTPQDSDESPETVRKVYVKDLREKQPVHTVFKATRKLKQTGRSGKSYLMVTLGDRTGEVDARVFDRLDELDAAFLEGDYVLVRGTVTTWQKRPQIVIDAVERLDPEPIDPAEFAVPPRPAPEEKAPSAEPADRPERTEGGTGTRAVSQIRELVERVQDPFVRKLLVAFLEDPDIASGLPHAPAAKGVHHAYKGGLADHILSVMKLAHRVCDHYPVADRDLVLAGALLHDIYKVKEISAARGGFEYTDEGRLVGHIVMTAQKIREKASRIDGFPPMLEHHLTHIVLSHHGQMDWGSPKVPMTLEALLVHQIDTLDSRVASWLEIMERDPGVNWTENARLYDRHLWKGPSPTTRGRSPVEGRPGRRTRGKRGQGAGAGRPQAPQAEGQVPTFKPLHALEPAPAAPPAPEATPPAGEPA